MWTNVQKGRQFKRCHFMLWFFCCLCWKNSIKRCRWNVTLTVSASLNRHSWLNRHLSTLFSKICQLLNVLFSKISPQNLDFFIDRRRFIDADTVVILLYTIFQFLEIYELWVWHGSLHSTWGSLIFKKSEMEEQKFVFQKEKFLPQQQK